MENEKKDNLYRQPTYIKYMEYTPEEFEMKLRKARGIISSLMACTMNQSTDSYNSNKFGEAIENLVFEKIRSNEVSKRLFLDWYKNYEDSINICSVTGNLGEITLHSINCLIRKVEKEDVSI